MPSQANVKAVDSLVNILDERQNFILMSYRKIKVNDLNQLRNKLREDGAKLAVVKNTLFALALNEKGYSDSIKPYLNGPSMVVFSSSDLSGSAKLLKAFIKEKQKANETPLEIRMGVSDGSVYDKVQVEQIADLPSREQLIAKIMGSINAPATGIVGVMSGIMAQLARAIEAVAKKKNGGE